MFRDWRHRLWQILHWRTACPASSAEQPRPTELTDKETKLLSMLDGKRADDPSVLAWWCSFAGIDRAKTVAKFRAGGYLTAADYKFRVGKATVPALQDFLKARGLPAGGKKDDLVNRVIENVDEIYCSQHFTTPYWALSPRAVELLDATRAKAADEFNKLIDLWANVGLREAAKTVVGGNAMYQGLMQELSGPLGDKVELLLRKRCAQFPLTNSLPARVLACIHLGSLGGLRAEGIAEDIRPMLPGVTDDQLVSIARIVAGITRTALVRARAEELGIHWYEWSTLDQHVRTAHQLMDKVLVRWADPPTPELLNGKESLGKYHAGESNDCLCEALPLVSLDQVKWPHKVHVRGRIVMMSQAQFTELPGARSRRR